MACGVTPSQVIAAFTAMTPAQQASLCGTLNCPETASGVTAAFLAMTPAQLTSVMAALDSSGALATAVNTTVDARRVPQYANDGVTVLFNGIN
jgi:hypothetical protein